MEEKVNVDDKMGHTKENHLTSKVLWEASEEIDELFQHFYKTGLLYDCVTALIQCEVM